MSIYKRGHSDICIIHDQTGSPTWQATQDMSVTKTIGGSPLLITFGRVHACARTSITWGGHQFLKPGSDTGTNANGQNSGWNHGVLYPGQSFVWNVFSPNVGGGESDTDQDSLCGSNCPLKGKNATGDGWETLQKARFWVESGVSAGGSPGHPGQNKRELCEMMVYEQGLIRASGNAAIVEVDHSVLVPTDAYIQGCQSIALIPHYFIAPNPTGTPDFSVMEAVNVTTGAVRTVSGGELGNGTSTTEVYMFSNVAGTFAFAAVVAPALLTMGLGTGVFAGYLSSGSGGYAESYQRVDATGAQGVWFLPTAVCIGARADLIGGGGAIVQAVNQFPTPTFTAGKTTLP